MKASSTSSGWTPASIPYYRDDGFDRNLIPCARVIRESSEILSNRNAERVVAVSDLVVRYGVAVKEREGQTLLFLEHDLPGLPVPKLLAMFRDGKELFIVMERIRGERLDILWPTMPEADKARVMQSLKTTVTRMRTLKASFFGSVDGSGLAHHLFYTPDSDPARSGPFKSEEDLNKGLLLQYQDIQTLNGRRDHKSRFYSASFAMVLRNHAPTFCHADIQRKNIIVSETASTGHESNQIVAFLVDWEDAGWYPEYWEYFAVFNALTWDDDWCEKVHDSIQAWPSETAMMRLVYTDLFI